MALLSLDLQRIRQDANPTNAAPSQRLINLLEPLIRLLGSEKFDAGHCARQANWLVREDNANPLRSIFATVFATECRHNVRAAGDLLLEVLDDARTEAKGFTSEEQEAARALGELGRRLVDV